MRIGILTFHEVLNPGAFWQACGTCAAVKRLGHDPVVIDYTSPPHRVRPMRRLLNRWTYTRPWTFVEHVRKNVRFKEARGRLMPQTAWIASHELLSEQSFDAVLIGADIVWDFRNPHLGQDPVYFGHHLNTPKLISWSASMGPCDPEGPVPEYVRSGLPKFTALSARDEKTADFARSVSGRSAQVLVDPAFQLDAKEISQSRSCPEPYIAVYVIPELVSSEFIAEAEAFSKAKGIPLYAVGYRVSWADKNFADSSPEDWVGILEHADYVFTGTFHGTVFSILLGKQFVVEYNHAIESKACGMMERLGLENRVYNSDRSVEEIFEEDWSREHVQVEVDRMRNEALVFLEEALTI